jgi:DNA repair exonuclease SbcCD ATPase subunit
MPKEVKERFKKQRAQAQEAFAQLKSQQDRTSDLIKGLEQKVQTEEAEEKAFREWLETSIEDKIFGRVKEQVQAVENESAQEINEAVFRLQEAARQILQKIQTTGVEIDDLKQKIRELQVQQKGVSDQIDKAGKELHTLGQEIEETRKIIEERNTNRWKRIVAAVGIAAGSIFATWAIACCLKSTYGVTLLPQHGGAALRVTIQSQL